MHSTWCPCSVVEPPDAVHETASPLSAVSAPTLVGGSGCAPPNATASDGCEASSAPLSRMMAHSCADLDPSDAQPVLPSAEAKMVVVDTVCAVVVVFMSSLRPVASVAQLVADVPSQPLPAISVTSSASVAVSLATASLVRATMIATLVGQAQRAAVK